MNTSRPRSSKRVRRARVDRATRKEPNMHVPALSNDEQEAFLQGDWVAKLATHGRSGAIRITPLEYAIKDDTIHFTTWASSTAAANLRNDARASVLIDDRVPRTRGSTTSAKRRSGPRTPRRTNSLDASGGSRPASRTPPSSIRSSQRSANESASVSTRRRASAGTSAKCEPGIVGCLRFGARFPR